MGRMPSELGLRRGLRSAVLASGVPYGYTLTTFATGQAVIHSHGSPPVGLLLLFAAGGGAAYWLLRWVARSVSAAGHVQLGESPHLARAGVFQAVAIGGAILAAALAARLPEAEAWPAASFLATLIYLAVIAVELAFIEGVEKERVTHDEALGPSARASRSPGDT